MHKAPLELQKQPAGKRRAPGAPCLWQETLLRSWSDLGEARDATREFSRPRPDSQPAALGGFAILGSWCRDPPRDAAPDCAHCASVAHHAAPRKPAGNSKEKAVPIVRPERIGSGD